MVRIFWFAKMATGLAVLGIVRAITIDNHLMPTVTDCYERLAIGERLLPENVYKFFNYKTVAECKRVCSDEKKSCKAFAFGISAKGNATCELSIDSIKESADLKPLGTLPATDFDLYIKKLDCTLVTEPNKNPIPNINRPSTKPVTLGNLHVGDEFHHDPLHAAPGAEDRPPHSPDSGQLYGAPPPVGDDVHNVQTLVSIASGPQSVLNPVHGILVAQESPTYGGDGHFPPYKPQVLKRPYDSHDSRPDRYVRPNPDYGGRPNFQEAGVEYADGGPLWTAGRPQLDRFDVLKPWGGAGYTLDRYGDHPSSIPYRPEPDNNNHRPLPDRYGSLIPHPDTYEDFPTIHSDYLFQQSHQESFSEFYHTGNDQRPNYPSRPAQGYDHRPSEDDPNGYHFTGSIGPSGGRPRPSKPLEDDPNDYSLGGSFRPGGTSHGYDEEKPVRPGPSQLPLEDNPNDYSLGRPTRPGGTSQGYEDEKPARPTTLQSLDYSLGGSFRPGGTSHGYDEGKPVRPRPSQLPLEDNPNDYSLGISFRPGGTSHGYEDEKPVRPRPSDGYGPAEEPGFGGGSYEELSFYGRPGDGRPDAVRPGQGGRPYEDEKPSRPNESYSVNSGKLCCSSSYTDKKGVKPIVSHSTGYNGGQITSIITQLEDACFRRVLAGKRVSRSFVQRVSICDTVEECQKECADEKRFSCEGFNYRLDPTGRGKGECELIDQPLARIDLGRDLHPHPDYDYYERDRNAATANCEGHGRPYGGGGYYGGGDGIYADRRLDYGGARRPPPLDYPSPPLRRPAERWPDDGRYPSRRPLRPEVEYDGRRPSYGYDYRQGGNRRGDYPHHTQDQYHPTDGHYLPPPPIKPSSYEPYLPPGYHTRKDSLDYTNRYLPPSGGTNKPWGLYDSTSSAENHHQYGSKHSYWASDRYGGLISNTIGAGGAYLPLPKPAIGVDRVEIPPPPSLGGGGYSAGVDSAMLPAEPRRVTTYNFIKDECSLRSATGFRLHKGIVKKFYAVPSIQECERLCFKEKDFPCSSYAFRYTIVSTPSTDNCYLSNRNYKELDYYTDLEPDKNFDIYTMNNKNRCEEPILNGRDTSDCFWRVRSGQRLDHKIVRDSLIAKSIVECQLECLKANKFTCRAFSYRYGSPTIGGSIDNCQLTDWPFYELDPKLHFIPEVGFEVYERGSFGHGCEPDHFGIGGHHGFHKGGVSGADRLCYIGFGSPARLLPQATKKALGVNSELKCKEECSKARAGTLFQCMSFSFRTSVPNNQPNCFLSDIYQRDLLPKLDYIHDPDSWLFAWDNYNPECVALARDPLSTNQITFEAGTAHISDRNDFSHALDTWRVYSVSGWPCRRGALCRENREAGFWSCELEGGDKGTWDYCCRPDHRCGSSRGYPYQWCYVGPSRTQWRKCSDRYFPYIHNLIDRVDSVKPYLPPKQPWVAPPHVPPSLDQYEAAFDEEFLDPPKPGGFGQPRHWPVSYLHKEMPPNVTDSKLMRMEKENPKYAAIQNLIEVIRSNDLQNVQYHISNESNTQDDVLFVKIPLPANFTQQSSLASPTNASLNLEPVDIKDETSIQRKRSHKSLPLSVGEWDRNDESSESAEFSEAFGEFSKPSPLYRRAFITRTNVTMHTRQL